MMVLFLLVLLCSCVAFEGMRNGIGMTKSDGQLNGRKRDGNAHVV